ncbi:hypothetical protein [Aquabacterium sp. OR-4]|uniref:hypothetical protein n=1 Tax=Aquabacterium sp. OR-4 TaxID=2978127 RepID=UPI0028C77768|nr:hypothetical protein [Aquabacterium sp. OR-4]MDT7836431.1 hypothetical protein [Aquabacterium sp. OR-4]
MHRWILGGGWLLAAALAQPALAARTPAPALARRACPAATAGGIERFITADCADCWAAALGGGDGAGPDSLAAAPAPARRWTLDWLLPRGADAAMAAAALPEASERSQRAGLPAEAAAPGPNQRQAERRAQRPWPGLALRVSSGPAWQGYFGLQLRVAVTQATRLPAGSTAWLALVEHLPAGQEGSALPRQLVRSVAGPLPLQALRAGQPLSHLQALRWPAGAQPERLRARGWIEAADGRMLAMAGDRCD